MIGLSLAVLVGGVATQPVAADSSPIARIDYPSDGGKVAAGDIEVRGRTDSGASSVASVLFAVDMSGSTAWYAGNDCDGDGQAGQASDDFNNDGNIGDILDCEIGAVTSLNASLRGMPNANSKIKVGLVPFGSYSALGDVSPDAGEQTWVAPGDTGSGADLIPHVETAAATMNMGYMRLFTQRDVGGGTDFALPMATSVQAFADRPPETAGGPAWVFFLSDGQAPAPDMSAAVAAGIRVKTFAVNQQSCNQALESMAVATGQTCTAVPDPSALPDEILQSDSSVLGVDVTLAGPSGTRAVQGTVDALGNFSAIFSNVTESGSFTSVAKVRFRDGSVVDSQRVSFTVSPQKKYVALGDSYSSGEGLEPYIDQREYRDWGKVRFETTEGFLCHRSTAGWPQMVTWPGSAQFMSGSDPDLFTYKACSGARLVNLDTSLQEKEYYGCPAFNARGSEVKKCLIPLQLDHLGKDVDLVTMTIGGNDLGFGKVVELCVKSSNCMDSPLVYDISLRDWSRLRLALLQKELKGMYSAVRDRVGKKAIVVAATYPYLFDPSENCVNGGVVESRLSREERAWMVAGVNEFADRLKAVAEQNPDLGLTVADVRTKFTAEHSPCGGGEQWLYGRQGRRATDLNQDTSGLSSVVAPFVSAASYHPNSRGAAAYAGVVNSAIASAVANRGRSNTRAVKSMTARSESVTDPDAVIASFPSNVVNAVQLTTFAEVSIGSVAANKSMAYCEALVPREKFPFSASGFLEGSKVTASIEWEGGWASVGEFTSDANGIASGEIVLPDPAASHPVATLRLIGENTRGGPVVGLATTEVTTDETCVAQAKAAGAVEDKSATSLSVRLSKKRPVVGQKVTLVATVNGPTSGSVTFRDSAHRLGSAEIKSGRAVLTTRRLAGGKQVVSAAFDEDAAFAAGSTSVRVRVKDTVRPKLRLVIQKKGVHARNWRARDSGVVRRVTVWQKTGGGKFKKAKGVTNGSTTTIKGRLVAPKVNQGQRACVRAVAVDWAGNRSQLTTKCLRVR